ncbi:hypothetical protein IWZ03DRAFT_201024 [Phyllosticta citriasiana]|uniref:Secreted protein n=1 Tax=Phyllosticta citriasiana TaxID=595635 RepID=A0ABR1KHY1_9PEZI
MRLHSIRPFLLVWYVGSLKCGLHYSSPTPFSFCCANGGFCVMSCRNKLHADSPANVLRLCATKLAARPRDVCWLLVALARRDTQKAMALPFSTKQRRDAGRRDEPGRRWVRGSETPAMALASPVPNGAAVSYEDV